MSEQEPKPILQQPEFDGGSFTIDFLTNSTFGLELQNRNSLRRRQGKYAPNEPLPLSETQRTNVTAGMKREVQFAKKQAEISEEQTYPLPEDQRSKYLEAMGSTNKVGIRNPKLEDNTLSFDTVPVPFPFYRNIRNPQETEASLELADPTGTALILFTADNKLILQHRSAKNSLYGDIPGASAAGMLDRPKEDRKQPGTLPEITTENVKANVLKEMREEIGVGDSEIEDLKITGFASDKATIHKEFLLAAQIKLSAEELEQRIETKKQETQSEYDFDENFFVIDGSADSLRKLLTEVKCPLPPTHAAAIIAAWYSQMLEEMSVSEAKENLDLLKEAVSNNYKSIDLLVRAFDPTSKGYDSAKLPQEQGLPDITSELIRTRLLAEGDISKETKSQVENAWLFDVDGVITSPLEKKAKPEMIDHLVQILESGEPLALVTGRALKTVMERVVIPLQNKISNSKYLENLYVSGEFGGSYTTFENGTPLHFVDKRISVPQDITEKAKNVAVDFEDVMFVDPDKETMVSIEMNEGLTLSQFKDRQEALTPILQEIINNAELEHEFEVHVDTIATNLRDKNSNKKYAARQVLEWMKAKGIEPAQYYTFGDSSGDKEMFDEITDQGQNAKFIFVGNPDDINSQDERIFYSQSRFDLGTLEYLKSLQ